MITKNEKKILRFLLVNFDKDCSINEIAKKCELSHNGAYEILKKFEKSEVILPRKISNLISYKINFNSKETVKLLELTLLPDYNVDKIRYRYNDLKPLEEISSLCIIFGSYITKKEKPNDIDAIFVVGKANYKKYSQILENVKMILPLKLHDVIQTKEDLSMNIKKRESIIIKAISEGVILWGHEFLIEVIKNVAEK